jgi:hypothetical protein
MTTPSKAMKRRQPNDAGGPSKRRGSTADDILLTGDQFRELIASLNTTKELVRKGTFTTCTARFQGQRDRNTLERFIAAATTFKTAENIGDREALMGLSILLEEEAGTWWLGAKGHHRDLGRSYQWIAPCLRSQEAGLQALSGHL